MSTFGTDTQTPKPFEGMMSDWTIRIENQKNSLLNQECSR